MAVPQSSTITRSCSSIGMTRKPTPTGQDAVCPRKLSGKRRHEGRKDMSIRGETGGMKTIAGTGTTVARTRSLRFTLIPKGFRAMAHGTRAAMLWSGVPSGTTKRIRETLHPVKSLSDRNGAAAGVIRTSSPSAVRSAPLLFPKRLTIFGVFGWCCRWRRGREELKYGEAVLTWACTSRRLR